MASVGEIAEDALAYVLGEIEEHNLTDASALRVLDELKDLVEGEIAALEDDLEAGDEDEDDSDV